MVDYFASLTPGTDPAASVRSFYEVVGRLDTLDHVTNVAAEARTLAVRHGLDLVATNLAALAHDLASIVPVAEMPAVAQQLGVSMTEADKAIPMLLHGPIAAAALAERLNVQGRAILDAVRYHTTLRPGAGALEKVIFVADKLAYDPASPHHGDYVPKMQAAGSLEESSLVYLDFLMTNAWRYRWVPHPTAVAAYRELVTQVGNS
jgi:predicted HD superfamily hydrolase involved in NAD metabolism